MDNITNSEWYNALKQRHGTELQSRFSAASVAVCGLGGLGSNVAISLARAGIGRLHLIDFDRVDISNLHRQQYAVPQLGMYKTDAMKQILSEISPYCEVVTDTVRLNDENLSLIADCDIVCECFDSAECKAMLTNLVLETMPDKFLVAASGMAGFGSANTIKTRKVMKHFYLCGDEQSDVQSEGSLIASRVMLCAAHQAHTVLRILAGEFET